MTRVRTLLPDSSLRVGGLVALALAFAGIVAAEPAILRQIDSSPTLERDLRVICDELGPRPAGSRAMRRAAQWALGRFQEIGVDEARLERFEIPRVWREESPASVGVVGPVAFDAEAVATAWSPPLKQTKLEVILADGIAEGSVSGLGDRARGKAVLVLLHEAKTFLAMGVQQSHAIRAMREAKEAGVAVLLFASMKPHGIRFRHLHTLEGEADPVPSVVLARAAALRLGRLIESVDQVEVRVSIPTRIFGPAEGTTVVAEIRGTETPDEVVLLGAHLDSWDLGTGCLDNGVNAAAMIEAARAIVASGLKPKRSIRFALFDAEESGLFGSQAYVESHRSELDDIVAVIVHDMGQGRIQGYALGGRPELEEGLRRAMSRIDEARELRHTRDAFLGSDHFPFELEGIPALVAIQHTGSYVLPYHSEIDTFDKVDLGGVKASARIAAGTAFGLANLDGRIGERLDRDQVGALLRRTGLEQQMKFLDLWDDWEAAAPARKNP